MNKISNIFSAEDAPEVGIFGKSVHSDSNILVTVTSVAGENSAHISGGVIRELKSDYFVESAPTPTAAAATNRFAGIRKAMTISGYASAIVLLAFSAFSFNGDIKARIVMTGSMAPAIHTGDIILTTPISHKTPKKGDVIAYQAKRFNGEKVAVFSHRIMGGDIKNGFIVKGDSNKSPDSQKPKAEDILGVVVLVIPYVGNLLTPKALFLLVPCLFGFWLILDAMKNVE
jgi:signal peptidase I